MSTDGAGPRIEQTVVAHAVVVSSDEIADVLVHEWSDGHFTCSLRRSAPDAPRPWGAERRMSAR